MMDELCEWIDEEDKEYCILMGDYASCAGVVEMCNCEGMRVAALRSESIDLKADADREEGNP